MLFMRSLIGISGVNARVSDEEEAPSGAGAGGDVCRGTFRASAPTSGKLLPTGSLRDIGPF